MQHHTLVTPFTIAPLEKESDLDSYHRLPELVASVSNEVRSSQGGCFLVTGYRGVGKTSFVNKVLQTTKNKLKDEAIIIPVRLSLARGYSTDKLLRRLIRELFHSINKSGIYEKLDSSSRQKLNIAFLRTSRQIKTALAQGLKEAVSNTEAYATRNSSENKIEAGISVEKLVSSIGSFSSKYEKEASSSMTQSKESSSELGVEVEFLEYDDEIAENDLSDLIDLFHDKKVEFETTKREFSSEELRWPGWFWKPINKLIPRIKAYSTFTKSESIPHYKKLKLLFVLDEIDKMSIEDAEQIFRSLKNLFLKGNVFFFLITGKAFYYDWLRMRTSEDDIFFSLFTRIIHIPLFSEAEFDAISAKLAKDIPLNLLTHLKYKAKGTPREFLRELSRFIDWSAEQPTISISQTSERVIHISEQLYPYIKKFYDAMEKDDRIDIGIKDHLRRSLHNWLEWMTILVTFTQSAVMRPTTEGEKESDKVLFSVRTQDTLDKLFSSLLNDDIIKDTQLKTNEESIYTFTGEIRESLEEIDSTISSQLPSAKVEQERNLNLLVLEFYQMLDNEKFEEAKKLLPKIRQYDSQESKESARLEKELTARELTKNGDKLYSEGLFESAFSAYRIASANVPDSNEIKAKLVRTKFAQGFEHAKGAEDYDAYLEARSILMDAIENSHEFFETDIARMKKEAKEMVERIGRMIYLQDRIADNLKTGEYRDTLQQDYQELSVLAPTMRSLKRIDNQIRELMKGTEFLEAARTAMSEKKYDQAQDLARQALASKNERIADEAQKILLRIQSTTSK